MIPSGGKRFDEDADNDVDPDDVECDFATELFSCILKELDQKLDKDIQHERRLVDYNLTDCLTC